MSFRCRPTTVYHVEHRSVHLHAVQRLFQLVVDGGHRSRVSLVFNKVRVERQSKYTKQKSHLVPIYFIHQGELTSTGKVNEVGDHLSFLLVVNLYVFFSMVLSASTTDSIFMGCSKSTGVCAKWQQ